MSCTSWHGHLHPTLDVPPLERVVYSSDRQSAPYIYHRTPATCRVQRGKAICTLHSTFRHRNMSCKARQGHLHPTFSIAPLHHVVYIYSAVRPSAPYIRRSTIITCRVNLGKAIYTPTFSIAPQHCRSVYNIFNNFLTRFQV
jgi:hypothetical protein